MKVRIKSGYCPAYLTFGKAYEVVDKLCREYCTIYDDLGKLRFLEVNNCCFLNGGSWEIVNET